MSLLNYVPYVLSCPMCVVPYVPRALRALVLHVPRASRVLLSYVARALRTLVLYVPRALRVFCLRASCQTCSQTCSLHLILTISINYTHYEWQHMSKMSLKIDRQDLKVTGEGLVMFKLEV